jgi:hypothetical protein
MNSTIVAKSSVFQVYLRPVLGQRCGAIWGAVEEDVAEGARRGSSLEDARPEGGVCCRGRFGEAVALRTSRSEYSSQLGVFREWCVSEVGAGAAWILWGSVKSGGP